MQSKQIRNDGVFAVPPDRVLTTPSASAAFDFQIRTLNSSLPLKMYLLSSEYLTTNILRLGAGKT